MSFYESPSTPSNAPQQEGALSWDSDIEKESSFEILPKGIYQFQITAMERDAFSGSDNMSACPMANLTLRVKNQETGQEGEISNVSLFLHTKTEWKLSEFFICIGDKKKGEIHHPNWQAVIGKSGVCELDIRKSTSKTTGKEYTNNVVKTWIPPEETPAAPPQQMQMPNTPAW